jgi:RHS repeat-associated protein
VTDDQANALRALKVLDPVGGQSLWLYRSNITVISTNVPAFDTTPYGTTLTNRDLRVANSFHWGPRQYPLLTHTNDLLNLTADEYRLGRRQHWIDTGTNLAVSVQQDFSPDGTTNGLQTWYDYALSSGSPTQRRPLMLLRDMPVGPTNATWFTRTECNTWGLPTNIVTTWSLPSGSRGLRTNSFTYSTDGRDLIAQDGPDGSLERGLAYSERQVIRSTNAMGEVTYYSYNSAHQLEGTLRPSGLATTNYYFSSGAYTNWLERTVDYQGTTPLRTNAYTYTNGLVLTHTDERDLRVTNSWDALGRLLRVDYPDGTSIQHTYSKLDRVRTVDRLGFTNGWAFDALRRMTYATNALGRVTEWSYCNCGSLDWVKDANGSNTLFYYDLAGRRTNTSGADGFESKVFYNLVGQVTRATDSAGLAVTNYYNHQGLLYTASNAFGRLSLVQYDVHDRATNSLDANGITITNSFDALGRVLVRGYPDGGVERFAYTTNVAAVTRYTNQLNQVTAYAYDVHGRKTAETNANSEVVQFAYSPAGDLIGLTDGKSQQTQWQYDGYGRVTNKLDNLGATAFRYAYDANSRLTNRWTPAKGDTGYAYDAAGNLTNINYATSPDITLRYDALNRLTNLVDAVGTSIFTYNTASQLLSEDGPWTDDTVAYTFTQRRRTALTLNSQPSTFNLTYGWDPVGRLTNVTSSAGSFGYAYVVGQASSLSSLSLPGGNLITNAYDSMARLLSTKLLNPQQSTINSHTHGYNLASQRTAATNTPGNYWQYGYDPIGQLTTASGAESNAVARAQEQFGYAYDAAWNLQRRTNASMVATFAVDSLNQLTSLSRTTTGVVAGVTWAPASNVTVAASGAAAVTATGYADWTWALTNVTYADGTNTFVAVAQDSLGRVDTNSVTANLPASTAFAYDANGNLRTNGQQVLEYDDENQLTTNWVAGSWKAEHVYDGLSRRRIERNYGWIGGAWTLTNEVRFIYDGRVVIQERIYQPQLSTNSPQQFVSYTRGRDLSGTFQGAGGIGGLLARSEVPSTLNSQLSTTLYHADGNGNITCLISTNGLVVAAYQYDPYGNALSERGPLAAPNRYRFSSKPIHQATGLYDYLHRWYLPELQRWLRRDPLGLKGGLNLYAFVQNGPTIFFDSFGHYSFGAGYGAIPLPRFYDPPPFLGNCYQWALGCPCGSTGPDGKPVPGAIGIWPGFFSGGGDLSRIKGGWSCSNLLQAIKSDFRNDPKVGPPVNGKCPDGYHAIQGEVGDFAFHFWRQDADGSWSEVPDNGKPPRRSPPPRRPDADGWKLCEPICVPNGPNYGRLW